MSDTGSRLRAAGSSFLAVLVTWAVLDVLAWVFDLTRLPLLISIGMGVVWSLGCAAFVWDRAVRREG
ncbi:hypothetical protein I5Q34_08220 [Streptomyces sp. AV19]|uniref:hypothetical protein n=1 Tax=Streptomyces sp. AV19 TaxID=2793068 RepID=UPI0018FE2041|nr:hypothetical protein [Streptomyces sp. AV19]MBH1934280.1 hypothetical protein [Streptomyces sp. AV19]MDG4533410.1 hypothetical protein [Streptomyces sp. AV19]